VIIAIFGALFRGAGGSSYFYRLSALQYYVPTTAAISLLGSCYRQLAIVLSTRRQNGILKRVRATPLPLGPSTRMTNALYGGRQCVPIYPSARRLTARTVTPPAAWLLTPSKDGACSATA
jgi:hypothetical protein